MNDEELDRLVNATAAVSDETVTALLDVVDMDISAELIAASAAAEDFEQPIDSNRRYGRVGVFAAAAAVLVVAGIFGTRGGNDSAWAAPLVEFAESSPLLSLDAHGWVVTMADEFDGNGEIDFANADMNAELHWYTSNSFDSWLADRKASGAIVGSRSVPGGEAAILRYDGTSTFTALWPDEQYTIEFRTVSQDLATFEALLDGIEKVDVDTWLSAMPDSVIDGSERTAVIEAMLVDIALPEGFDSAALNQGPRISDRHQLGAHVVGAVSCAWIKQWLNATDTGDDTRAAEAIEAMTGLKNSAIAQETDHGSIVAEFALEAMADGDRLRLVGVNTMMLDGVELNRYQAAFGCSPAQ